MKTPRILIAAEHASRRLGGEAILPYHYFRVLRARSLDAHLIVHERTRPELEALFPDDLDRMHFVPDHPLQRLLFRLSRPLPRRVAEGTFGLANNLLTQRAQRPILRRLITAPTVIHQPIPVSPRYPSWLSDLGAPVVIGPLNGGMHYPPAFSRSESIASRALVALGRSFSNLVNRLIPGKRKAAAILVANPRTRAALPSGLRGQVVEVPENAVDLTLWPAAAAQTTSQPTRTFTFLGRLVDWKALDLVLEALAQVPEATLDVIGDGPMLTPWRTQALALGLENRVQFLGYLPQAACAAHLSNSVALLLPSLYECGGAVVLEAMAMGKPVIATAWGGPADYLDQTCGILLPPSSRAELVTGFARAMQLLLDDPGLAARLGQAGRIRLKQSFDWEDKVDTLLAIYRRVLPR